MLPSIVRDEEAQAKGRRAEQLLGNFIVLMRREGMRIKESTARRNHRHLAQCLEALPLVDLYSVTYGLIACGFAEGTAVPEVLTGNRLVLAIGSMRASLPAPAPDADDPDPNKQ